MYDRFKDHVNFLTVYIQEAHPSNEWRVPDNLNEEKPVCYLQPKTIEGRMAIAKNFIRNFEYQIPLLIDTMKNEAKDRYSAYPERIFVIDERGILVYIGKPGPFGYHPEEVNQMLEGRFGSVLSVEK